MEPHILEDTPFDKNFLGKTSLETKYPFFHTSLSWSAIFAGLVTALAVSICLSFLIATLGSSQMDFTSSSPFRGSFLSIGLGSLIVMLISLASGGFIAGRFAETAGVIHGFLTWSLITLFMTLQSIHVVSSTANLSAKTVEASTSIIQQTVNSLSPLFSKINSDGFEKFFAEKDDNGINFDTLNRQLHSLLNKGIPALNPDRLKQTYQAALNDIGSAITALKNDPSHYSSILNNLRNKLFHRLEALTAKFDETANRAAQLYQRTEEKTPPLTKF